LVAATLALLSLPLLAGPSLADDFSNPTPIVVPLPENPPPPNQCPPTCPSTPANPYPSNITVSGLTGVITDVNVTLKNLSYTVDGPPDLDIMVVSPDNKTVMLMSDDCGDNTNANPIPESSPITLAFDDQAAAPIPADTACSSGSFRPLDDDNDGEFGPPGAKVADAFPAPAPAPPDTTLPLSTFNGIVPNGTWSLYVVDDVPGNADPTGKAGQIAGGWSLSITTPTTTTTTSSTTTSSTSTTVAGGGSTSTTSTTSTTIARGTSTTTTSTTLAAGTTTTTSTILLPGSGGTTNPAAGSTAPILRVNPTTVPAGQRVTVAGDRFPANAALQLNFLSVPVSLGNVTTNASGSFQSVVTIPANATAGAHQINATNSGGTVLASVDLTVTRTAGTATTTSGRLARTGMDMRRATGVALLAMALGVLVLWSPTATRNRHHWKRRMSRRRLSGALTWK